MKGHLQIGRLAMRQEGGNWNAYYAKLGTMDGAILLGSCRMTLLMGKPERRAAFLAVMRDIVADIIEEAVGTRPAWGGEQSAPEHEKAGNA